MGKLIYTLYAGAAGMLLHINGKYTMGKLKSWVAANKEATEPS
jgi:hypothetical protein